MKADSLTSPLTTRAGAGASVSSSLDFRSGGSILIRLINLEKLDAFENAPK